MMDSFFPLSRSSLHSPGSCTHRHNHDDVDVRGGPYLLCNFLACAAPVSTAVKSSACALRVGRGASPFSAVGQARLAELASSSAAWRCIKGPNNWAENQPEVSGTRRRVRWRAPSSSLVFWLCARWWLLVGVPCLAKYMGRARASITQNSGAPLPNGLYGAFLSLAARQSWGRIRVPVPVCCNSR